jgi:CopG family nickel-responsive transcriptional regulator
MHRVTISLEHELAREFDRYAKLRGYQNRSEAVRDLVRQAVAQQRANADDKAPCVASLSYIYNHQERNLAQRLMSMQHEHHTLVISATHVHLDNEHSIETLILRGPTGAVQAFADELCVERGVRYGSINLVAGDVNDFKNDVKQELASAGGHRHQGHDQRVSSPG